MRLATAAWWFALFVFAQPIKGVSRNGITEESGCLLVESDDHFVVGGVRYVQARGEELEFAKEE